ncbi:MAG: hypothetical protein AAGC46_08705 [Solirubrobacteraceae bacterium]|nr:hypothetical protein [Patulibacter sp.]
MSGTPGDGSAGAGAGASGGPPGHVDLPPPRPGAGGIVPPVTRAQRRTQNLLTALAIVLAALSVAATLERSHWLNTHYDDGQNATVITKDPAPAQSAIFPSAAPGSLLQRDEDGNPVTTGPAGGVSLSSTPSVPDTTGYEASVAVAQVHALTAIAAVQACAAREGVGADCTKARTGSLGTQTGLAITHGAPAVGEVRVLRKGPVYSATAAAQRGIWYAVTLNVRTQAESRICLSHHGKQRCPAPTW